MLTIRLMRTGKKNQPSYKVVVTDRHNPPRGGKFVEEVGFYNPKTKEKILKKERILHWLSVGAQASDTIHNMLVTEKIIDKPKRKIIFTKKPAEAVATAEVVSKPEAAVATAEVVSKPEPTKVVSEVEATAEIVSKPEPIVAPAEIVSNAEPTTESTESTEEPKAE